ncbi:DUF421 domain-containing protein [Alkalihalobacillus sp. LMS39]|uniref:YetF domain-containing protein n=1 Tax=Alkalihalobacillus sp. LMS39 TaxID=2924032 RepID=UPI001FB36A99|nr:DUF421 domain-containing protein [Alkalihalobacillus sp. LMS39]UOE92427.1 DUF421 domain-containing protein [Alkalihalobacillus sp. LMS39]
MNTNFFSLTTELLIGFFALLAITKLLGKTQITQLTPFDFISALVLGELVGNAIYDKEIGLKYVLYAITLWGTLIFSIEKLTQVVKKSRTFLEGNPSIIIRRGKIDFSELKRNQLDINQLQHLLREKDVFSLREIEYAILEPNGSVSVMKKSSYQTLQKKDVQPTSTIAHLPITIISDGEILLDNLKEAGFDEEWLSTQLLHNGVTKATDVLLAEWLEGDSLYVAKY